MQNPTFSDEQSTAKLTASVDPSDANSSVPSAFPSWLNPQAFGLGSVVLLGIVALFSPGLGRAAMDIGIAALVLALVALVLFLRSATSARRAWGLAALALVVVGALGLVSINGADHLQASQAEAHHAYATAVGDLKSLGDAPPHSQELAQVYVDWGKYDVAHHAYADAIDQFTYVAKKFPTTPQAATANAQLPTTYLAWAEYATAQKDVVDAGKSYLIVLQQYMTSTAAEKAFSEAPAPIVAYAAALHDGHFYSDAYTTYQFLLKTFPNNSTATAARPAAAQNLYDWAQALTQAGVYDQAALHYQDLIANFGDTPAGQKAATTAAKGTRVQGQLLKADGKTPVYADTTVRISSKWMVQNGVYVASGSQYLANTDSNGYFVFPNVPPGQYMFEWRGPTGVFETPYNGTTPTDLITVYPVTTPQLAPIISDQK